MQFACGAVVALLPFYLFARASFVWTPRPEFFPDDAFYARLCLPDGLALYWHDFGLYRILTILPYALLNRAVMRAGLSPALLSLIAIGIATLVFVWACLGAGLSRRRGALLAGIMLGSPLLLETVNFWSGTLNYTLVLLLVAAQLRAVVRARRTTGAASQELTGAASQELAGGSLKELAGARSKGLIATACGALLALLTYEIALPFVLATSALYVRGWLRRAATVGVACVACVAFVAALAVVGLYWPQRFKLAAEQFASAISETATTNTTANPNATADIDNSANGNATANANTAANANTTAHASVVADAGSAPLPASPVSATHASAMPASTPERAKMYVSLLFSFIGTGLRSAWFWALVLALAGMGFLSRPAAVEAVEERRLPESVVAFAFAFALVACVGYLALTKSMNARYIAFLLIYGTASLAWTRGRVARYALVAVLLVQAAVAAGLPVHLRDVELASKGGATVASAARAGDLISVNGRLARASWAKRFLAPPPGDVLTRPLNPRACRYSMPCEECK